MPCRAAQSFWGDARGLFAIAAAVAGGQTFAGGSLPNYGFQWSTVTHPGNAPTSVPNGSLTPPFSIEVGRVDHEYRIMTREVSVRQWFDFVRAYAPHIDPAKANSSEFTGSFGIQFTGFANGVPTYTLNQSRANEPVLAGWRYGARFANFLHNGAPDAAHATAVDFENGAYDTTTFATVPNPGSGHHITDQAERSAGAKFFFPTYDERTKAAYWDPDKDGPGQPGWWLYPITSDTAPIPGAPANGGQTNTGPFPPGQVRPRDVASYPDVMSPWGLLDCSGGASEWLEDLDNRYTRPGDLPTGRTTAGSATGFPNDPALFDLLRFPGFDSPTSWRGIRLASIVPSPGVFLAVCFPAFLSLSLRRRRLCE